MRIKLIAILLTACSIQLSAHVFGQRITLNERGVSLAEVLRKIEKQSGYTFFYNKKDLAGIGKISVAVKNEEIAHTLEKIFQGKSYGFEIEENVIVLNRVAPAIQRSLQPESIKKKLQQVLRGTVTDSSGNPLGGVSVLVQGTSRGTATDDSGNFQIQVERNEILGFRIVGYSPRQVTVGTQTTLRIVLQEASSDLDEVVVVGYGVQKKVNLTGAVSTINMSEIAESRPITSLSSSLHGLAAGLTANQGNARPGGDGATLLIRGRGTLNNAAPLVIVDGVESNMNNLNPQDVETISVLKDASSAAIYGSRAANGVILITTKKGKEGALNINYNGYLAAQRATSLVETVSDFARHMELYNESATNTNPGSQGPFAQEYIDLWRANADGDPYEYANTDWRDLFGSDVISQNHNVAVSGGTDRVKVFSSFGYLDNPGIIENTGFKRYSGRINLEAKVKPYLTVGVLANGTRTGTDLGAYRLDGAGFRWIANTNPAMVYRHPDGRYGGSNSPLGSNTNNLLATVHTLKGDARGDRLASRFYGILNPLKGLTIEASYSLEETGFLREEQPNFIDRWNFRTNEIVIPASGRTYVLNRQEKTQRRFWDGVIRYQNNFLGSLNVHAMAGLSQEYYKSSWFEAQKYDLIDPSLSVIDAAAVDANAGGNASDWGMNSYFGRLNLDWNEKYLLEANLRYDGSSRFRAGSTRWGVFPSVSAGWRLSQEDFMSTVSWVDELKLRASYGSLGNNSIGNYEYQALYASSNYILNRTLQTGFAQTAIANAIITWESTYVTNIGLDFGLLNNALRGSVEFFDKDTRNILINLPAPNVRGTASLPNQNAARVNNRGLELDLNWSNRVGNVNYQVGTNLAYVKNNVTKFKGDERTITNETLLQEGYPINVLYVLAADRIVQTDADLALVQQMIDNAPLNNSGNRVNPFATFGRPQMGDLLYKDLNGDGIVNNEDRYVVGDGNTPRFSYGLTLALNWKGLDFSCLVQGVSSLKDYWLDEWRTPTPATQVQVNKEIADGRWVPGRTDATYPRLLDWSAPVNKAISDFWIVDKRYVRLKNVQLGYRIPSPWAKRMALESIRVYCSFENLLTFTNYNGFDPELRGGNSGIDSFNYPTMKQSTIGLTIDF